LGEFAQEKDKTIDGDIKKGDDITILVNKF